MGMQISNQECFGQVADVASGLQGSVTEAMNGHEPSLMAVFTARPEGLQPVLDELGRLLPHTRLVGAMMPEPAPSSDGFTHAVAWAVTGQGCVVATGMAEGVAGDHPAEIFRRACPAFPEDLRCPHRTALLLASSDASDDGLLAAAQAQLPAGTRVLLMTPHHDTVRTSAPVAASGVAEPYSLSVVLLATARELDFETLAGGVPAPCLPDHQGRVQPRYEGHSPS